jgi:hypothetical protein
LVPEHSVAPVAFVANVKLVAFVAFVKFVALLLVIVAFMGTFLRQKPNGPNNMDPLTLPIVIGTARR